MRRLNGDRQDHESTPNKKNEKGPNSLDNRTARLEQPAPAAQTPAPAEREDRLARGFAKLREVDGQAGVDVVESLGDLGRYIVEFGFGDIYSRKGLSLREREIATVAVLTALGREPQLRVHLGAAFHVGLSRQEIEEVILQTVPYSGFPPAINAMNLLRSAAPVPAADGQEETALPGETLR